ncbi:Protein LURP-one-related 15 [Apostasia shenzhenica]|uniref:Protein LURP-one-related 15 n=1 Tax=Apostasia shenzhenica TaxID=1088818 RepID=A0A2I0A8K6_9ASPA|nr:Protein LURP-one-related 15 [Apostasia shenzhenica]
MAAPGASGPSSPVVVVDPKYCARYIVDLTVAEKALTITDADYAITDAHANVLFKVKGKILSLHDRCFLQDADGNTLLSIQKKRLSAHRKWQVFRGESWEESALLFSVKKSSVIQHNTKLDVCLAANSGEGGSPDFVVKGGHHERSATIYLGESDVVLARVTQEHKLKDKIMGKDVFGVSVYPNVDYAFIAAVVVVLHEINEDRD